MIKYQKPNIIPASTVMNATINSLAMPLENAYGYSIQLVWTGTPTGTFKLQSSCDPVPKPNLTVGANGVVTYTPTNWTDIANTSQAVSAAGSFEWDLANVTYNYVRVVYTDGSSGAATAIITVASFVGAVP